MKKVIYILALTIALASCSKVTKEMAYPKMYEEKPLTILIMPPINNTDHAEAKDFFYSSLYQPIVEKGYYVISPALSMDILRQESAYDSEQFINGSLKQFKNVFGADAALFTTIDKWEKKSLNNSITVGVTYVLKSTSTGEVLYERSGEMPVGFSKNSINLVKKVYGMIKTAMTDKIVVARKCNKAAFYTLPYGPYSPKYEKDKNEKCDFKHDGFKVKKDKEEKE